ncbi:MAG: FAD:protein FMN transferase [Oscillospiraceae bacterium]|nr:FAD:protein FMN transferase [Oscillospiraceae bacterium]
MKRLFALLAAILLLSGCSTPLPGPEQKQYTATFLTLFDTVTTIVGKADSKEAFQEKAQAVHDDLLRYHQLFDIYKEYAGINNLKTVNDAAGTQPVTVDNIIIELLLDCKDYYETTGGKVNVAMGSVLALWHEARSDALDNPFEAALPDMESLTEAKNHTDWNNIIIDSTASTVHITDPALRLDVGAIAKGWAVQRVAENAPRGLLISVGGNVCATGPKDDAGTPWVVGIRDPEGEAEDYLHTVYVTGGSVVTSGDYQRAFMVDGQLYHHIIDPETLYPSDYWRSVTIICPDSGLADALSTALFLLPLEEGQALLNKLGGEALWVNANGELFYSPGFQKLIRT